MDDINIIKLAKDNGYFHDMVNYITDEYSNILEYNEKTKTWCYLRADYSGRDFYDSIPIYYITEDEKERLAELLIEDSGIEDYEWGMDIDEVKEWLWDEDFIEAIFDYLSK